MEVSGLEDLGEFSGVQELCCGCCSVAQSCPTLFNPVEKSTPGLPVLHPLPELAKTHVRRVGDASNRLTLWSLPLLPSIVVARV